MKCTALAVTALVALTSVTSATDYQPALLALAASRPAAPNTDTMAAGPTERQSHPPETAVGCNGVPPLHDNLHKVIIKYEYYVRTNTTFSQYYPNR